MKYALGKESLQMNVKSTLLKDLENWFTYQDEIVDQLTTDC